MIKDQGLKMPLLCVIEKNEQICIFLLNHWSASEKCVFILSSF
jgi:hypothetical protein